MLPGLVAAALSLSACALLREAPPDKTSRPGCPGYPTMVRAVAIAMDHADRWGIVYDPKTVEIVWLPEAWVMDFQPGPGGTAPVITMSVSMDGRMLYCRAAEPCFGHEPLDVSTCPAPPQNWISGEEALRIGRLYLYRKGLISHARQPARVKRTGEAKWVVFFIGGPEKDRDFTIEVSPAGKVIKFLEGV